MLCGTRTCSRLAHALHYCDRRPLANIYSGISCNVGCEVGCEVGCDVGCGVGCDVGCGVGCDVGCDVGCGVGSTCMGADFAPLGGIMAGSAGGMTFGSGDLIPEIGSTTGPSSGISNGATSVFLSALPLVLSG